MKDILPPGIQSPPEIHKKPPQKRSIKGDLIHTGILMAIAITVLAGSSWLVIPYLRGDLDVDSANDPIHKREVLDYTRLPASEGDKVKYSYLGEKLPEKLNEKEVVPMRTENSYTIDKGILENGKVGRNLQAIIYPQPAYIKRANVWYYREYAVTSKRNFDSARKTNPFSMLFAIPKAYAVQMYTLSDDGNASAFNGTWAGAHDATTGAIISTSSATDIQPAVQYVSGKASGYTIARAFLPFDTSSLPASANITNASLNLSATGSPVSIDGYNDAYDYITVVQTSNPYTGPLSTDFGACGAATNPTEGIDTTERKDITNITTSAYQTFTLNSTGIGWVKKSGQTSNCGGSSGRSTGLTCLGVREGHDTTNIDLGTVAALNIVYFCASECMGTSADPYLSVSYSTFAPWQFFDY